MLKEVCEMNKNRINSKVPFNIFMSLLNFNHSSGFE